MALGDEIRRNILAISAPERQRFIDAIVALNGRLFPGSRDDFPAGGVSWWFKMDEIHQATHVHGGAAFLPWHRELCNYFESLLRQIDPDVSLHYWDWNQDISPLFPGFGNMAGEAGEPWLGAKFYDPAAPDDKWRDETIHGNPFSPWTGHYALHGNPADPPKNRARNVQAGAPPVGTPDWPSDGTFIGASSFDDFQSLMQGPSGNAHSAAHSWLGLGNAHTSFRDPLVFLLHSNVDRLWAMWQTQPGHADRLDPAQVYGALGSDPEINEPLQPWAGTGPWPTRPWYAPENEQFTKTSKHLSVVDPPCYDTLPTYPARITLETPNVNFNDVPEGETAARAIVFSAVSCHDVTVSITAGPTVISGASGSAFGTLLATSVSIPHIPSSVPPRGRLWISYKGTHNGDMATGTVTVHCAQTNQDFVVPIAANTIARPTVAVMLCLDQSGSMDQVAGVDATTKRIDVLHQAATNFVQLVKDNNGVGMVSFDQAAYPGVPVTRYMGGPFDPGRAAAITAIGNIHPTGATSIGNGLQLARATLNPVTGFDRQALVVFTDGLENTPLFIADVMSTINDRTFAVGLGTAQQVSTAALTALANGTGGYLLLSGLLSPAVDDYFRLTKYFLQILAGVTNSSIVTDPAGYIAPGMKLRIPFVLNETDIDATVILLTDLPPQVLDFRIETPNGDLMDPAQAAALGDTFAAGANMSYYRFTLPLPLGGKPAQAGTWYAVLAVEGRIFDRFMRSRDQSPGSQSARRAHGVRYSVNVHAYSNLRMEAQLTQASFALGTTMTVQAALTEYGIPVERRASMRAELSRPDGSSAVLPMVEVEPGIFRVREAAFLQGVYRFRVMAAGVTMRGDAFTREQLVSGAAVPGGDQPFPKSDPGAGDRDEALCQLLRCLLQPEALGRWLANQNVDPAMVEKCLEQWCKRRLGQPSADELRRREGT